MSDVTKSFKYKQWKESKFNKDRTDIMTANTIANMKSYTPPVTGMDIHGDDRPTGDGPTITSTQTVSDAQKQHQVPTTPTSIGVSLHGGDSGSNIPDRNRARDRGRTRDKGETGQIAGAHHFRYGGLAGLL